MRVVLLFMALIAAGNCAYLYFPIFGGKSLDLVSNGGSNSPTCMMTKGVKLTGGFCFEAWINPWDPYYNFNESTLFYAQDSRNNTIQFDISTQEGTFMTSSTACGGPPYGLGTLSAWCGLPTLTINGEKLPLSDSCFFPSLNNSGCNPDFIGGTAGTLMGAKYVAFCLNTDSTAQFWTTADNTFPEILNTNDGNGNTFTLTANPKTSAFLQSFNGNFSTVFIGGRNCNGSDPKGFYGRVDEVRISDLASFTNVSDNMMRRKARDASNYPYLRHYWDFEDLPNSITDRVSGVNATLVNKVPVTSNSKYTYDKTWPAQRYFDRDIYSQTSQVSVTIPFGVTSNTYNDGQVAAYPNTTLLGDFSAVSVRASATLQKNDRILFNFTTFDAFNLTINIPSICQSEITEGIRTIVLNTSGVLRSNDADDSASMITFNVINPTISITLKNYTIFNETVNGTVVPSLSGFPAEGGNINLFGSFPNPLTNNVTIYMRSSLNPSTFSVNAILFNQSNVVLNQNTLKSMVLPIPAGIGNITIIKIAYCHLETPVNLNMSYQAANVTGFSVIDDNHLLIRGTWMGPNRTIDGSRSYDRIVVELNKTGVARDARQAKNPNVFNCVVNGTSGTSANQTHIRCLVVANVSITAAELNISTVTVYIGSNRPARSGVVGFNAPPPDSVMTTGLAQEVQSPKDEGFGRTNTIIVIVVLVGIAIIVAVLIVVVIVVVRRNKRLKGETKKVEMIPLHRKDFGPLIFGEGKSFTSDDKDKAGNLAALEDMLLEADMKATFAVSEITQITEADYISRALVIIFESRDQVMRLLHTFIEEEVKVSESAGTLFRSNSMVSKMFKFYSRLIGLPYLYETIGPDITQMLYDDLGLEVDPERMEAEADLDEMRWTLMAQSQKILKAILNSVNKCPMQFRIISYYLQKSVGARFADSINKTIGGFMFLRFFCPAVTSPESYGIVDEAPSASERRLLILMTKALQNLSNDVEFGSKEPYMIKMNDFILSNREKLNDFFSKLIHAPTTEGLTPSTVKLPKDVKENALVTVGLHIRNNLEKVKDPEMKARFKALYSDL